LAVAARARVKDGKVGTEGRRLKGGSLKRGGGGRTLIQLKESHASSGKRREKGRQQRRAPGHVGGGERGASCSSPWIKEGTEQKGEKTKRGQRGRRWESQSKSGSGRRATQSYEEWMGQTGPVEKGGKKNRNQICTNMAGNERAFRKRNWGGCQRSDRGRAATAIKGKWGEVGGNRDMQLRRIGLPIPV